MNYFSIYFDLLISNIAIKVANWLLFQRYKRYVAFIILILQRIYIFLILSMTNNLAIEKYFKKLVSYRNVQFG